MSAGGAGRIPNGRREKKMSKRICIQKALRTFGALLLVFALLFALYAGRGAPEKPAYRAEAFTAVFPASLLRVEEEAFFGTSFETAVFHDSVTHIGDRAFMNAQRLQNTYLPDSVSFIGADPFPRGVLIHGAEGSYAQSWAAKFGFEFMVDDIWHVRAKGEGIRLDAIFTLLACAVPLNAGLFEKYRKRRAIHEISMRPQDRIELYPINYRFP